MTLMRERAVDFTFPVYSFEAVSVRSKKSGGEQDGVRWAGDKENQTENHLRFGRKSVVAPLPALRVLGHLDHVIDRPYAAIRWSAQSGHPIVGSIRPPDGRPNPATR